MNSEKLRNGYGERQLQRKINLGSGGLFTQEEAGFVLFSLSIWYRKRIGTGRRGGLQTQISNTILIFSPICRSFCVTGNMGMRIYRKKERKKESKQRKEREENCNNGRNNSALRRLHRQLRLHRLMRKEMWRVNTCRCFLLVFTSFRLRIEFSEVSRGTSLLVRGHRSQQKGGSVGDNARKKEKSTK